ncbi:hypothetical protein ACLKA7_016021 [Drosophila subpalustris]
MCFLSVNILRYQTLILAAVLLALNIMDTIGAIESLCDGNLEKNPKFMICVSLSLNIFVGLAIVAGIIATIQRNRLVIMVYMIALIIFGAGKTFIFCMAEICADKQYELLITDWYRFNATMGWICFIFLAILFARMNEEARRTLN